MNMIQANAIQQQQKLEARFQSRQESGESPSQPHSSPVRQSSIFGALTKPKVSHESISHGQGVEEEGHHPTFQVQILHISNGNSGSKKFKIKVPTSIEDVPFRRQDRRILNARRKRMIDRSLIRFVLSCGTILIVTGASLILMWFYIKVKWTDPFLIIGPVISGCGVLVLLFSVEICVRLYKSNQKVLDPEIDNLTNLHQIKHWVDPKLIPFGWGQYSGQSNDYSDDDTLHYDRATLSTNDNNGDSPHKAMAFEMQNMGAKPPSPEIPADIFDESLRYSSIDRPRFHIERTTSPPGAVEQIRGDFMTEEERIANLFKTKNKGRTK